MSRMVRNTGSTLQGINTTEHHMRYFFSKMHFTKTKMNVFVITSRKFGTTAPSGNISVNSQQQMVARLIDLDNIVNSLKKVSNFSPKRQTDIIPLVLIYEISDNGESTYRKMSLRELLNYVNVEAHALDAVKTEADKWSALHIRNSNAAYSNLAHHLCDLNTDNNFMSQSTQQSHIHHTNIHNDHHHNTEKHSTGGYNTSSELNLRDLHRLDYLFNLNEEKSVLVRRHAVLFAMDPVRAIVMSNR